MTLVDNHKPNITIVTPKGNVIIDLLTAEVEISEGVLVSEAAKVFWEAIKLEGKSLAESKAEAERLREENAELQFTADKYFLLVEALKELPEILPIVLAKADSDEFKARFTKAGLEG